MRVDVLGAVAVWSGGRAVAGHALGGRRARVALVALALAGGPLPADRLASMIWADQPPTTWPTALRGVIRGLRAALDGVGAGGQRLIATVPSGYCLAPGVEVDLHAAAGALRYATALTDQGRYDAAIAAAEPATRLAGDQLLPGEDAVWLDPYRREVDATALRALEVLARAAGAQGDHHRATEAGHRAVAASPLDERSHRLLIRALHQAGDRSGAVQAYEDCRALLADQLGVDPDPETVDAYLSALGKAEAGGAARLPLAASAFFGRDAETAWLADALREPGLVTVTGKGGVGKSRLALHVAAPSDDFDGGKIWISLRSVVQDELVASTVAMTMRLALGGQDATTLLAEHLAPRGRVLLVLDGCEAIIDGVATLVSDLLSACPMLSALITSRVPLSLDTERVIGLEPLMVPARGSWPELMTSSAVLLLADRVRGGGGQLEIDVQRAPLVAELCRRCGGLPLALELAAAQLTAMSVADLLDHLPALIARGEDRLRSVAQSSYELLGSDEATVFRRLGILDGQVALPLVRDVVAEGPITGVRVVRILRELTARGLASVDRSGARWRYQQDDDLHQLAREMLAAADEEIPALNRLYAAIGGIIPGDPRASPAPHLEAIGEVLPAIRSLLGAAVDGLLDRDAGLELSFRLHRYWAATNVAEGRFWLSRLLAGASPSRSRAYAEYALGYLSYWSGDAQAAVRELGTAVEMLRGQPDDYAARALIYLGGLADDLDRGNEAVDYVRRSIIAAAPFGVDLQVAAAIGMGCVLAERSDRQAAEFAVDAIELCRRSGSAEQLASTLPTAAMVCWQVGELEAARQYVAEAMPLLADSRRIARVVLLSVAAGLALADGDLEAAVELGTIADADGSSLGIERELPLIRCLIARALLDQGDSEAAAGQVLGAITAARSLSFTFPMAVCLETAALVNLARPGNVPVAARLLATAAAIRERGNRPGQPTLRAAVDRALALVADQLPAAAAELQADLPADVGAAASLAVAGLSETGGAAAPAGRPAANACLPDG